MTGLAGSRWYCW